MEKKNVVDVKNLKKTYLKKGANLVEALKNLNLEEALILKKKQKY